MIDGERPGVLPSACGIAFKEWAGVCRALATGRQSLILRKGGIDEGPAGFTPEHDLFWLYPTHVHQAQQGLKPEVAHSMTFAAEAAGPDGTVPLDILARVHTVGRVSDPARLAALDGLHVWTAETVESRFRYKRPGLWVLGVRIYHRDAPLFLPMTPEHAGCKTWVPLTEPMATEGLSPALGDQAFASHMARLNEALAVPLLGPN